MGQRLQTSTIPSAANSASLLAENDIGQRFD
jgi:hypothetical protein